MMDTALRHLTHRTLLAGLVFLAASGATYRTALATPVVDQNNSVLPTGNFTAIRSGVTAAQTFTVGFPGTLTGVLVVVDPRGTPASNLVLEIQSTSGGVATGTVLATAGVAPFGGVNPTVAFDVSAANLAVTSGEVLAFVLKSNASLGNDYLLRAVPSNKYTAGQVTDSSGGFTNGAGWDAIFKTQVEPATLPDGPGASDQFNHSSPTNNFTAIFSGLTAAQTFTVGTAGTLTGINVMLDPRGGPVLDIYLEVQATTAGVANGTVLARASLPPFIGPNASVLFDLGPYNLDVTAGEVLAFVLRSNAAAGTDYLLRIVPGDTYEDGGVQNSAGSIAAGWDAIFDTYVYAAPSGVGEDPTHVAGPALQLAQNHPNPVRREATLAFSMPVAGRVNLSVFDISGRRVRTLVDGERSAGQHEVRWDRTTDEGGRVPAGIYFYRLSGTGESQSRRMVVVD